MKTYKYFLIFLACVLLAAPIEAKPKTKAEKQGWKLSMQSYTLHLFSVVEALEKTGSLGLKYIEIYPGQKMGEGFGDAVFGYDLTVAQQKQLKKIAKQKGVRIISSGVWTPMREEWGKVFAFAKSMGMEFISAEPARTDWDVVEQYALKYKIKVSTHNHPNKDSYWQPEILLSCIGNRSNLLGSCADVGHFKRMNLDAIESLHKLSGRVNSLHFKDIAPKAGTTDLEDIVWGTGILNVKGMLQELKRQNFKGYFTIEYEADWENNLPKIRESINYFNKVADEILP